MFKILSVILKKKKYIIIAIVSMVVIGSVSYYLTVVNVAHKNILVYADMNGMLFTITSLILGVMIAVLAGLYLALMIFRRDIVKAKSIGNKAASFGGVATGLLASGCPSCGVPLLGLIGFPLALYSLPFKGLELKILSIIFLAVGVYLVSKNIKKNLTQQCSIDFPTTRSINTT